MKKIIMCLIIFSFTTIFAMAHGGGTDGAGGHHDYNNVSGLGSYHYHHGYGPHLHDDGICPYEFETYDTSPVKSKNEIISSVYEEEIEELESTIESLELEIDELKESLAMWKMAFLIFALVVSPFVILLFKS